MSEAVSAGGVIFNNKGEILLIKNPKTGFLGFPKGHVEKNESVEQAAIREVKEETGLQNVEILKNLGTVSRRRIDFSGNLTDEIKHVHLFLMNIDGVSNGNGEEEWNWFDTEVAVKNMKYEEEKEFLKRILADIY